MKIRKKEFEKDGKGSVGLLAEESEDLWHLYNLVSEGDEVKALTYRKVQRDNGGGSETKKLRLTIEVKKVEYDAEGDAIRFAGTVCEENEWVKMGAHHTIEIELHELITITKQCWDAVCIQQMEDATDIAKAAEVAVVLIEAKDQGTANISLLTNVLAKRVAKIEQVLPRKRLTTTQIDKAMEKFFISIYAAIKEKVDFGLVKCVVLGGPGTTKTEFHKWFQTHAMQQSDTDIVQKKGIFVLVDTTGINNDGLNTILTDPQVQKRVGNTKAALHFKALEELQVRLNNQPERACYGPKEVKNAVAMGAIDTMMISDALFRNASVKVRKEYVDLVEQVKAQGCTVYVFSSGHVTGQKLAEMTGIAANLRFQVDYDEDGVDAEAAAAAAAAEPAAAAASSAPAPAKLDRTVSTASNAPLVKPGVAELTLALGGKVSEVRIEHALAAANGVSEDAYLVLLGQELDGTGKEPVAEEKKEEAKPLVPGDMVEVVNEFGTNSKTVVQLSKGQVGNVIKIDNVGDAYIDFGEGFGKQWVKPKSWCHMNVTKSFAPPPREGAGASSTSAPAASASGKAVAKKSEAAAKQSAAAKAKAATKPKAKAKKAVLAYDDYDYY